MITQNGYLLHTLRHLVRPDTNTLEDEATPHETSSFSSLPPPQWRLWMIHFSSSSHPLHWPLHLSVFPTRLSSLLIWWNSLICWYLSLWKLTPSLTPISPCASDLFFPSWKGKRKREENVLWQGEDMRGYPRSPLFGLTRLYQYPSLHHSTVCPVHPRYLFPFFKTEKIRSGTPVSMSKLTEMEKAIWKDRHYCSYKGTRGSLWRIWGRWRHSMRCLWILWTPIRWHSNA